MITPKYIWPWVIVAMAVWFTIWTDNTVEADNRFSIEPIITITTGDGEPAHDIPRIGLQGRYQLDQDLYLTLSINYTEFDFERPYKLLGIDSADENDSTVSGIIIGAGSEKEFRIDDQFKPYVGGGMAVTFIDADEIVGLSQNGLAYNINTETGNEYIPYLNGGIRWLFWHDLSLNIGARLEYHLADWKVTDRVSNRSHTLGNYFQYGGYIGFTINF